MHLEIMTTHEPFKKPHRSKTHKSKTHVPNTHRSKTHKKTTCPVCPIGLKPFQKEFSKKFSSNVSIATKKKLFVKQLLSKFAPHYLQPQNDFYDYINYQWLKNVTVDEQQQYIVQIDNFRLTQDKVYHELDVPTLEAIYQELVSYKVDTTLEKKKKERELCEMGPWNRRLEDDPKLKAWAKANPAAAKEEMKKYIAKEDSKKNCSAVELNYSNYFSK